MSKRGRKAIGHDLAQQSGPFKCSECEFVSDTYLSCEDHISRIHQGLARMNGKSLDEDPMDRKEMIGWVKKASSILEVLTCKLCEKNYSSALGFVYHVESCGKNDDELWITCEICGKRLKKGSFQSHTKTSHSSTLVEKDEDENVEKSETRQRRSAILAKNKFAEISDDSEEEARRSKRVSKKKNDEDFLPKMNEIKQAQAEDDMYDDENKDDSSDEGETKESLLKKIKKENRHSDRTIDKNIRTARYYQNELLKQLRNVERQILFESKQFFPKKISRKQFISNTMNFLKTPLFKSTSLQSQGDNEIKQIEPFECLPIQKSCFINVGFEVQAAAWCPQPLPEDILNSDESYGEILKKFKSFSKSEQYLAILTNECEQNLISKNQILQIWKFTPNNNSDNFPTNGSLQLLIKPNYGKIFTIQWCPNGATWQENNNIQELKSGIKVNRMGLLALACEDSCIRILSIPHGLNSFEGDVQFIYNLPAVLILKDRENISPCTCLSWSNHYPYSNIVGGYQTGLICYWNLQQMAFSNTNDESSFDEDLFPERIFVTTRRAVVNELKWLNSDMFMSSHHDTTTRIWNLNIWNGIYDEFDRDFNIIQKIEAHPTWYDSFLLLDIPIKRKFDILITCKTLDGTPEFNPITHWKSIVLNDMTLSPWQYVLTYCTANGSIHSTLPLRNPFTYTKKTDNFTLFSTLLGDLTKKEKTTEKQNKKNELINKRANLNFDSSNFFERFYLIFNDQFRTKVETKEFNSTYLTENDIDQVYSITNIEWCPNILASDWLFCSTKTGICWVSYQNFEK